MPSRARGEPCVDCGSTAPGWGGRGLAGRGLCSRCYERHHRHGTLIDFPMESWRAEDLMAEWDVLRGEGFTRAQAAERLGITKKRLEKAIERQHRKAAS